MQGHCWTYKTQLEATELLRLVEPGLGYNLQLVNGEQAAGMNAKHIAQAELVQESISFALHATQGPQHMLSFLEGHRLADYVQSRTAGLIPNEILDNSRRQQLLLAELINSVWTDSGDTWQVISHVDDLCLPNIYGLYVCCHLRQAQGWIHQMLRGMPTSNMLM